MWAKSFLSIASFTALLACGNSNGTNGNQALNSQSAGDSDNVAVGGDEDTSVGTVGKMGDAGPQSAVPGKAARPRGALTRICPMGDSITAGDSTRATYRRPLWLSLQSLHANVDFVGSVPDNNTVTPPYNDYDWDNEGHGGIRSDELANNLPQWIVEYAPPDIVLLHIGTNDLGMGRTTSDVLGDIARLIDIIRSRNPQAIIVLAQIIGMTDTDFDAKARDLNAAMPAFADAHATSASPIQLVDQMTNFDPATMTVDGTHPNPTGEALMANVWLAALRPILGI